MRKETVHKYYDVRFYIICSIAIIVSSSFILDTYSLETGRDASRRMQ